MPRGKRERVRVISRRQPAALGGEAGAGELLWSSILIASPQQGFALRQAGTVQRASLVKASHVVDLLAREAKWLDAV
jgi:hypothetical protein